MQLNPGATDSALIVGGAGANILAYLANFTTVLQFLIAAITLALLLLRLPAAFRDWKRGRARR